MIQILYEYPVEWRNDEAVEIDTQIQLKGMIPVSPDSARRRANRYLGLNVGMAIQASDPVLMWGESPVWRLQIGLYLRGVGKIANLGTLDVDAQTREIAPLTEEEISEIQERADAIALRLTQTTEPTV